MLQPSPYLGHRAAVDEPEQRAQSDVRRDADGCGSRRRSDRPTIPSSARPARRCRRRRHFRSSGRDDNWPMYDPETGQADAHQHLFQHASPDVRRGCQSHAVDERRRPGRGLAQHEDVRRDRRRAEVAGLDGARSWTPTATASATPMSSPIDPVDPTKDKRFGGAFYAVAPAPDGSIWGSVLGFPGRDRPADAGIESAGDRAR